jgi:hypothetical protein
LNLLDSLFVQDDSALGPIAWWEIRRVPFNLAVGAVGVLSMIAMALIGNATVPSGEDFVEPFAILAGLSMAAVALNIWFTFGWIRERRLGHTPERDAYRKTEFRKILRRACFVATLPVWLAALSWVLNKL